MKQVTSFIIILVGFGLNAHSQNRTTFICPSDSAVYVFKDNYLKKNRIDSLIEFHYLYDNGRDENEIQAFIWQEKGAFRIKTIQGCDEVTESEIHDIDGSQYFEFYFDKKLYDLEHTLYCGASHDFGYAFNVNQNEFRKQGYIRDYRRGLDNYYKGYEKNLNLKKEAEKNPLVKWVNSIDSLIQFEIK